MDKCIIFNMCGVFFANIVCDNSIIVTIVPAVSGERRFVA